MLTVSSVAAAHSEIKVGDISFDGSACPQGDAQVVYNAEKKALEIQFKPVILEAGKVSNKMSDSKSCEIKVPVEVPRGYRVALGPVEYTGVVEQPPGTETQLGANYYYDYSYGSAKQSFWYKWPGYQNRTFSVFAPYARKTNTLTNEKYFKPFWSNCGDDFYLRMDYTIKTQTSNTQYRTEFQLDKVQGLELLVEKCN